MATKSNQAKTSSRMLQQRSSKITTSIQSTGVSNIGLVDKSGDTLEWIRKSDQAVECFDEEPKRTRSTHSHPIHYPQSIQPHTPPSSQNRPDERHFLANDAVCKAICEESAIEARVAHIQTANDVEAACEELGLPLAYAKTVKPLTLKVFASQLREVADRIDLLLDAHPELLRVDIRIVNHHQQSTHVIKAMRHSVWSVFARAGALLGRNTETAAKDSARNFFSTNFDALAMRSTKGRPEKGRTESSYPDPVNHIETVIKPAMDPDMLSSAYDMNTYRVTGKMTFYHLLAACRSRNSESRASSEMRAIQR